MAFPRIIYNGTGYEFLTLSGRPQALGPEVQDLSQPAKEGSAYRILAKKGRITTLIGMRDVGSAAAGKTLQGQLQALQGRIVKIVDDTQETWEGVMLLEATAISLQKILTPTGGIHGDQGTHLLTMAFTIQVTR